MEQNNQQPQNPNTNNPAPAPQQNGPAAAQSKKNLIVSGIVILVVLALLLVIPRIGGNGGSRQTDTDTEPSAEEVQDNDTNGTDTGAAGTRPLSRAAALTAYQGKMITVSDGCEVTPKTQTQPVGTTIMVNNDSTAAHTVTVGPKSYRVSGLHYTLSWLNLAPGTLAITCDGNATDATIVVQ